MIRIGSLWCPISWEPRVLTKADKHISFQNAYTLHAHRRTHTYTNIPPHQHRLAVISVELNTSNTLSSHLDQTKINSWLEDILCSHSDHFSLQYPAVTTYSRTLLGHGWLGPSKLLLLKRTLSWKNMGGPSLKFECWKVRFHAQNTY